MQKILIIDENQEETELLKLILEEEYEVTIVSNAQEGIACAGTGEHSLIFLTTALPGMEDFALLKELQGKIMPWHIPVILLMDEADVKKEEKGLALGAADYIARPVYPLVVKARTHTHVSLYQYKRDAEQQSAMTDSLTGVASRRRYELNSAQKWQEAVRLHVPVSICLFDVDRFRTYNERYGYPAGDRVLASVAEVASSSLKRSTDFLARYGGDQFVTVILGGEGNTVSGHMKRLCQEIKKLRIPHWNSDSGWVTVSIGGVTVIPQTKDSYETYFRVAQNMLSDARESGGAQVMWTNEKMEKLKGN